MTQIPRKNKRETASMDEWFLWRHHSDLKRDPWQRALLNVEFLKAEVRRIQNTQKWLKQLQRTKVGSTVDKIEMYALPTRLKFKDRLSIDNSQKIIALSALRNCVQSPILAIFNNKCGLPREYELIQIQKSKHQIIPVGPSYSTTAMHGIIVEEWDSLESDYIYQNIVPKRQQNVYDFLKKNIIQDPPFSESFQSPIVSSPPIYGIGGGITLASEFDKPTRGMYAQELCRAFQFMLPPEYRTILQPMSAPHHKWWGILKG
ncbi:MAG: hypothetical protein HZB92_07375 [Euryarchaeota archaeon]|nr:hypothetical protein [Euryarchaeota archaeon]